MLTKIQPSNIIHLNGIQPSIIIYGYGSIPINTIFNGMNIHLPAILMWTTGVQGFDTLPYYYHPLSYIIIWVCLKIGYIPNYSHLVGIMIINHWV